MNLSSLPLLGPVPEALLTDFEGAFVAQQRELCRQWRLAARLWSAAAERDRAFVADELALLMNVHPQSASSLMEVSVRAADLPALFAAWEALELTDRHVRAAVEELHRCLDDATVRVAVLDRVLTRCRERAAEHGWPRPGELRRMIRAAALLIDPAAAQRRERSKTDDRRTDFYPLPDGQAGFHLEGPAAQVLAAAEAVYARAKVMAGRAGQTRTLAQLEFDLAAELLTTGTLDGTGTAAVVEVQVVVPLSVINPQDDDASSAEQLGELVGYGPISPGTCRDLLARATQLRRILTDPTTGQVIAVDDAIARTADLHADLRQLLDAPAVRRDLSTPAYRPTRRATRFVRTRDRTCQFPGCTRPARWTDLDHRIAWPHGPTSPANLHCLCRHHHQAKQSSLFTVTTDQHGHTLWTTRTGRTYRGGWPVP